MNNKGSVMLFTILLILVITIISASIFTSMSQKIVSTTKRIEAKEKEIAMDIIMQGFMYNFLHESMGEFSINGFDVKMQKGLIWEVRYNGELVYQIEGRSEFLKYYIEINDLKDTKVVYHYRADGVVPKFVGKWKCDISE